jgi:hypothetical protein
VEDKLDFKGGNVHVITAKEDWDEKVAEANKDGKIVSKLAICSRDYRNPLLLIVFGHHAYYANRFKKPVSARYFHHAHFWLVK